MCDKIVSLERFASYLKHKWQRWKEPIEIFVHVFLTRRFFIPKLIREYVSLRLVLINLYFSSSSHYLVDTITSLTKKNFGSSYLTKFHFVNFFWEEAKLFQNKKSGKVPKQCHFTINYSIVDAIYRHEFMPIINCFMPKSKANYFYSIYKNTVQTSFYPFTFLLICGNTQKLKS